MTSLHLVELRVLGPLQVRQGGLPVAIPGAKPRAILTMLGLHGGSVVSADALVELLWGVDPPRTAVKALQTHISSLRRALGDGFVLTEGAGWTLAESDVDASRYKSAARLGRDAAAAGDASRAVARFEEALALWRGIPELPDGRRGTSEKTRWIEGHAALVEDRADALLATGRAAEIIGELEAAVADAPLRERRWGQLMLALYRAGRQGEALGAYQRARALLADELGVDPGPELRRLEAAIVSQDAALEVPGAQDVSTVTRAVTFLLTDIEGSTAAWEAEAEAMAVALARHDELVEQVVTSRGGRLIKTRGEGDATFSVFERPSAAAAAAIELQDAIVHEPWALREPMRIRVALHTGEVEFRDGDYFGRAVNRAARLRSLATGGQILCSGATAELVIDSLPEDVVLADLGTRQLRNLARPERVFELQLQTADDGDEAVPTDAPVQRPSLPPVLVGPGPFVGRGHELERLSSVWQTALAEGTTAMLIAGEPGVGKTRLAGEWSRQAYDQGALVIYGRCDEDLGAPYQPFAEALRSLVPCLGPSALRGLRGVEALLPLVPGLTEALPDLAAPTRADPDTERYALFDAVAAVLGVASAGAPVVLILDDLHWAAKPTLLLLRHVLRFGEHARLQIIGTYRSTDLDRSHPLAAMLADLHRDGTANRLQLSGLDADDVTAYVAEAGYNDEELARALASVTGGNPFFLIEALRHVDESGGRWDQSTLPQGVREAVSRRLSRLAPETNKALAAAAVVGSRFALELVERVVEDDLVDAFDEARKAGIVIEEPGGRYRFNHALVRQSLLAELPSVRRMRLHQRIATTLEDEPGADDELLAELAYHYFECAWAGNAAKAVEYCRRAADQAMARLAYEGAADLYDRALHALEEIDDELPDRDEQITALLVARCEALLAAGDVASAAGAVSQLQDATVGSARLAAWATCFDGELSMLTHPERLDEVEAAVGAAAGKLAELADTAGEAKAHTVRATCLARLGRIGDCEIALDDALTAARRAREHRRVNNVLANAPLAALWGPNPVPRAGGRCLDVVRLLRITTDSPAVEATSTRCQAVLEAFRGRAEAARRMIDSARRTVTELGLRHALLEVEQFAGIVELVIDDPAAAEPHLRQAYNGFRRMGLDADTAETAALLGSACLALNRDAEADELCTESERLAGHALKPSIAWRTLRARLLSRGGDHDEARRIAEAAVSVAERTDALVDHADACSALATVLGAAGDVAGARAAAERAVGLYERKGAAALAERARGILGERAAPPAAAPPEAPAVELDNACVRASQRTMAAIDRRDWEEIERLYSPHAYIESRRKIVGFTRIDADEWVRLNRRNLEGVIRFRQVVIAVRGDRLALSRLRVDNAEDSAGAPYDEFLNLSGIDEGGRFTLQLWFDLDDIDTAMAELDAAHARFEQQPKARRILGGRDLPTVPAAPEAPTAEPDNDCVREINHLVAALNREAWSEVEQLFPADVNVQSRRKIVGFTQDDLSSTPWIAKLRRLSGGTGAIHFRHWVVAVRGERLALIRLDVGTAEVSPGAAQDEMLQLVGLGSSGRIAFEVWFDVEDIDAALAELDAAHARLEGGGPRVALENAASRVDDRLNALAAERRWDEFAALLDGDIHVEDRRKGFRHEFSGRTTALAEARAIADLGVKNATSEVIAVRGERLALVRIVFWGKDDKPEPYRTELLRLTEIGSDDQIAAHIVFDPNDIDAGIAELDARYLAGEAAAHAGTWSVVASAYAALSQSGLFPTTPDWVNVDHRRGISFEPGGLTAYIRTAWNLLSDGAIYSETVHLLSDLGAVFTWRGYGNSQEGSAVEFRGVNVVTVEGELINRCEVFDEADLDTAIARFEQLSQPTPRLENAARQVTERLLTCFAGREWDAMSQILADNFHYDDRRRVVGAGLRDGRNTYIADMRAATELWAANVPTVVATRGERLILVRLRFSGRDQGPEAYVTDVLGIAEINTDERIVAVVSFDPDDFDAACEELDRRYLAGEAAPYSHTWSVVARTYAAANRQQVLLAPDCVTIDHRRARAFAPGELTAYMRATWDLAPNVKGHLEAVHRLSDHGAVVTHVVHGTSQEGFDAEWREVFLATLEGDLLNRCEIFDEADVDAAIAKLDQLGRPAPQLGNAASRANERFLAAFAARDWDALTQIFATDLYGDDRRPVVGEGIQQGRAAMIRQFQTAPDLGVTQTASDVIATRGDRLVLARTRFSRIDEKPGAFSVDLLHVVESDADELISAIVAFDSNDFDAALQELDARYLAGEAAPFAHAWSAVTQAVSALNRREIPPTTPDWVTIDHRRGPSFAPGELPALLASWNLTQELSSYIEAVHRLNNYGAVVTSVSHETSQEGLDAEWRAISVLTSQHGRINRSEFFDETDLDAALARFEEVQPQTRRLENAASQAYERLTAYMAARDWGAVAEATADDAVVDDRRRMVNAGILRGRDAGIEGLRAATDVGFTITMLGVTATRGARLALIHTRASGRDPQAIQNDAPNLVELDADGRIAAVVVFDLEDIDAAFAELDARYLAGEAAPYAHTWSVITGGHAAVNRQELPPTTPDCVSIDHRRGATFAPGDLIEYFRAGWDLDQNVRTYVEVVHVLSDLGAVCTHVGHGVSREGFDAEWRGVDLLTVDGDMVNRCEVFDEADLDTAIVRFEQLVHPATRPENTASRVHNRLLTQFAARNWDAMAETLAGDLYSEDRRRVVNAGVQRGREAQIRNFQWGADLGVTHATSQPIATRGQRLVFARSRYSHSGEEPEPIHVDTLEVIELGPDERISAMITFDVDDFDGALGELDRRYLAGEAAAHAHTWSVVVGAYAGVNRHEPPRVTPNWVNVDHRRGMNFAPGDLLEFLSASWDLHHNIHYCIEAVHRLSDLGAVCTIAGQGISRDGFYAEWRGIDLLTVEGNMLNRYEVFDEADFDVAIATFDQLGRPTPRLENAASRLVEQFLALFAVHDWDAMAELIADDMFSDDRRTVANAGIRRGRDAEMANWRATADVWMSDVNARVIATRGERLALFRFAFASQEQEPEAFQAAALGIVEFNDDNRVVASIVFDVDDFEAACEELELRYVAGDAAPYRHTWSLMAHTYAAFNRHELPPTTGDCITIDHRRAAAFAPGDMTAYLRAAWDQMPQATTYIEAVHRLSALGAVITYTARGTSQEGFDAEWRVISVSIVRDDLIDRYEGFDDTDLDAAIARFDELSQPPMRLENAASQVAQRFSTHFAARDWDAIAETLSNDISTDDRRRVVGAGLRQGRDAVTAELSAVAEIGVENATSDTIATRGERLVLSHARTWARDKRSEAFLTDMLSILEVNADGRIVALVTFDADDLDAAFEELDTRYLAGAAAAHSHTWSVLVSAFAAINRHELPELTPDWVNIDHRRGAAFATGDMTAYLHDLLDNTPDINVHIEVVHRLSNLGAVVTQAAHGTSRGGFQAEWREIGIFTFDGDLVSRCELFDDADLAAALARFEQLSMPAPRLENAASRADERALAGFAARDWDGMTETLAEDFYSDDRRPMVNVGIRPDRDVAIASMQTAAELGITFATSCPIATRGGRLVLSRARWSGPDQRPDAFHTETLNVVEVNAQERIVARIWFDANDIDAAFNELDAHYLAGEAAPHARTWSVITQMYAALNRHELPRVTPNWVNVDHRRGMNFAPGDLLDFLRAGWDLHHDINYYIEAVHRLRDVGAIVTHAVHGRSQDGFAAEWRMVELLTVEGELINRCELFDEADLDAAITRFDELTQSAPRLENTASRVAQRFLANVAAGDWDAIAETLTDDFSQDDRRRVVGAGVRHGREAEIVDLRAIADLGITDVTSAVIATRGERLVLMRVCFSFRDQGPEAFLGELLGIAEINAEERIIADVSFDLDDIDAAFEELDARYVAGEAAPYARVWHLGMDTIGELNRHEPGPMIGRLAYADHRRIPFASGEDFRRGAEELWNLVPDARYRIKAIHALDAHGSVSTLAIEGTDAHGNELQWGRIILFASEEPRVEVYEEDDVAAALARFEELRPQPPRLENAASQVIAQFQACFASRDWAAMANLLADDLSTDDRRTVVSSGSQHGRDVAIANMRAVAGIGVTNMTSTVIATRGDRLTLSRARMTGRDQRPEAFHTDVLDVVEINADNRMAAHIAFDPDDIDAAFAELDARYLAGEAAPYGRTWSVIARAFAALNRHELPPTTPDWANVDHRRGAAFTPGDLFAYLRAGWDLAPDRRHYIEAVHRLDDLGAVATAAAYGTSQEGLDAEWRMTPVLTVDNDLINRCEIFEEPDFDAALACFEQLHPQTPRLENEASRVDERFATYFAVRDWDAAAELIADAISVEDRRHVVSAGLRHGRDAEIANVRARASIGMEKITSTVIATRGERLALARTRFSGHDQRPQAFHTEALCIVEIDADNRIVTRVGFDIDDTDAAFEELESRYLAGEAAAHAHTWSIVSGVYAAMNRRELFATTPDWTNADRRRHAIIDEGGLNASLRSLWELMPDLTFRAQAVHRLTDLGAVCTHVGHGTSQEGFDAEWHGIEVITVEGDLISGCEIFDEIDLDAALARFEELQPQPRRLENAATQVDQRFWRCFADRDWTAMAELLSSDLATDDRRRVVNAGPRQGPDEHIAEMRAVAEVASTVIASSVIATRGERLALTRIRGSNRGVQLEEVTAEVLNVVEIDSDARIVARIGFDVDDMDAALDELDARYLAGEAAAHSQAWSAIVRGYAALNRGELPETTPDFKDIDHRRATSVAPGDLTGYLRAAFEQIPRLNIHVETVHRLRDRGAVVTHAVNGTSREGFDAEWRSVAVLTTDGDLIIRTEIFDETDLDAALARFEELHTQARRPENAASRVNGRLIAYFNAHDWAAMAETMAQDFSSEDRRHVVNAGLTQGREVAIANFRSTAELGVTLDSSDVIASRGERLVLSRARWSGPDRQPEAFYSEVLGVVAIDSDERIAAHVLFDANDMAAALDELDARYLAGEATAHARAWSVISQAYAAVNRHELPPTTPDWANVDHRRGIAFAPGKLEAYVEAFLGLLAPGINAYIETVHRLTDIGAIVTRVVEGTSSEGFQAEWREIGISTVEGELINRSEIFDETDLDAALARFDELQAPAKRLENAATRVVDRFFPYFRARDWEAIAENLTDDSCVDDRRHAANAGFWGGRDVVIANMRPLAGGWTNLTMTTIATRGERLALAHVLTPNRDARYGEFDVEMLNILEISTDNRIAAQVLFSADDFDAAFAELEARYLAGEAAPYARLWSVIVRSHAQFNRQELPAMTPDVVYIDHRPVVTLEGADLATSVRSVWDLLPQSRVYVEAVHRLTELGAVATQVVKGTSQGSFDAEWQTITIFTFEGDRLSRYEVFDETDVDTALARFDELQSQTRRLANEATRVEDRFFTYYKAHDWAAVAEILADDSFIENRVRVVNTGLWEGRDVVIANMRALAESVANTTSAVIAIRGDRLALGRMRYPNRDSRDGDFAPEQLIIAEIDTNARIAAHIVFDPDDIDAAFAELDARYVAGEAAVHAKTWSAVMHRYAALNRQELPRDRIDVDDHRRIGMVEPGDPTTVLRAGWDLTPNFRIHIETVQRLGRLGAAVTRVTNATSEEGFAAEWRAIDLWTVDGDRVTCCEIFDETDLDAALARFDELRPPARPLENAASRVHARLKDCVTAREWHALTEIVADDVAVDDRRRVVNSRIQHGRDATIADMRGAIDLGLTNISLTVTATRGERLALSRTCIGAQDQPGGFRIEFLSIVEIDADERIVSRVSFDLNDIDAAYAELDARYLAGEAAAHAHVWSVIAEECAAFNRHELPPGDMVIIDHRRLAPIDVSDLPTAVRTIWDLTPDLTTHVEAVHRLSSVGAVVTYVAFGTSQDGFDAEWRVIEVLTVEGDRTIRWEFFDESDLDAALARFDELQPAAPRLENAASQVAERYRMYFSARDWDAMAELLADDMVTDDRRRVVNAGIRHGRDVHIADNQAAVEIGADNIALTMIATRGERLALAGVRTSNRGLAQGFSAEMLAIVEINTERQMTALVTFDSDDFDAAFAELDGRYLAGEAAGHAHVWSVIARECAAFNRHELPAADWVTVDHRQLVTVDDSDMLANLRATWELMPDIRIRIEVVHRLSTFVAVSLYTAYGTTPQGFAAEWRMIQLHTVEGDRISRCEIFDETDLDAALARFDELNRPRRLENAATRIWTRAADALNRRDADRLFALASVDHRFEDRRKGLRDAFEGPAVGRKSLQAMFETIPSSWQLEVDLLAVRGSQLFLARERYRDIDDADRPITVELLQITEVGDDDLLHATVLFDSDDIDAAFEELEARYLAGEAAARAHTWSVVLKGYAALNRREMPRTTEDFVDIDHRSVTAVGPGDLKAYIRATFDETLEYTVHAEVVHRLTDVGAVVTHKSLGVSRDGFVAEWRVTDVIMVEDDLVSRFELFDEAELDAALARFDELNRPAPLENSATRTWSRLADAFNRRDLDGFMALTAADGHGEDRRKGLRASFDGLVPPDVLQAMFDATPSWRCEVEPIAIRGHRFAVTSNRYRDTAEAGQPIASELLTVIEVGDDGLLHHYVSFDPDDIHDAFRELTDRWIASGEVAHPEIIETMDLLLEITNRHDWGELATRIADAAFSNHRQLASPGADTIPDYLSSIRMVASLVPDFWVELAEVVRHSARGFVAHQIVKGTSTDGVAIEIPILQLVLLDGDRVTHIEALDPAQRDLALARFDELNQSG